MIANQYLKREAELNYTIQDIKDSIIILSHDKGYTISNYNELMNLYTVTAIKFLSVVTLQIALKKKSEDESILTVELVNNEITDSSVAAGILDKFLNDLSAALRGEIIPTAPQSKTLGCLLAIVIGLAVAACGFFVLKEMGII